MSEAPRARGERRSRFVRLGLLAAVLALVASGGSFAATAPDSHATRQAKEILIGAPLPLSGLGQAFGEPYLRAMQLTVDAINARGGIKSMGGAKLKLVVADDQSNVANENQLINQLAAQGVSAFVGPLLSATVIPSVALFTRLQIPFIGPQLDNVVTDQQSKWVFRIDNRATAWGAHVFQFLRAEKMTSKIKKVGIVGINVPPGTSTTDVLNAGANKLGWDVTRIDYDQKTTLDFSPIVAKLAAANVDLVTGYENPNDAILFAKAVAQQSWRPKYGFLWVAGGQYLWSFHTSLGSSINNWLVESYSGPIAQQKGYSSQLRALASQFQDAEGQPLLGLAGIGPSAITALAAAIDQAKSADPAKIRDALARLRYSPANKKAKNPFAKYPFYSVAGGVMFGSNGDNLAWRPTFIQWNPNSQNAVYPTTLATSKLVSPWK